MIPEILTKIYIETFEKGIGILFLTLEKKIPWE